MEDVAGGKFSFLPEPLYAGGEEGDAGRAAKDGGSEVELQELLLGLFARLGEGLKLLENLPDVLVGELVWELQVEGV